MPYSKEYGTDLNELNLKTILSVYLIMEEQAMWSDQSASAATLQFMNSVTTALDTLSALPLLLC